jgi:ligand-binding SRPBCC domain-containing protein
VKRLRKKIAEDPESPVDLLNLHGQRYRLGSPKPLTSENQRHLTVKTAMLLTIRLQGYLLASTWGEIGSLMTSIEQRMQIAAPIERCFDLARSIEVHLLGTERTGERAVGGVTTGLIGPNEFVRWRAKHVGVRQYLTSKITAFDYPYYFQDTMIQGAFKFFQHDHYFNAIAENQTEMRDRLTFAAPIPVLGNIAEQLFLKRYMDRFLRRRNEIVKRVAESDRWQDFIHLK